MSRIIQDSDKLFWKNWNPGLDNDQLTLGYVIDTLPGAKSMEIPWMVRFIENPSSPFSFKGNISLERHDCVHVLLGRGLLPQDEAFVIGFTMGTCKDIPTWQFKAFRWIASNLYPSFYRFKWNDLLAYDLGFEMGMHSKCNDINKIPLEYMKDYNLRDLRNQLGINQYDLRSCFREEQILIPDSASSHRLDSDVEGVDPSDILAPEGINSDWEKEKTQ